jgi:hypothetical protein
MMRFPDELPKHEITRQWNDGSDDRPAPSAAEVYASSSTPDVNNFSVTDDLPQSSIFTSLLKASEKAHKHLPHDAQSENEQNPQQEEDEGTETTLLVNNEDQDMEKQQENDENANETLAQNEEIIPKPPAKRKRSSDSTTEYDSDGREDVDRFSVPTQITRSGRPSKAPSTYSPPD